MDWGSGELPLGPPEGNMNKFLGCALAVLTVVALPAGGAFAQDKADAPKEQQGLGDAQVKQLLLMMDADKNGKISKQEWMNFMSAEFDRLDTDKSGELDPKELKESKIEPSTFPKAAGK
jgi:Ca2+-binding EF-hand superfamily protein